MMKAMDSCSQAGAQDIAEVPQEAQHCMPRTPVCTCYCNNCNKTAWYVFYSRQNWEALSNDVYCVGGKKREVLEESIVGKLGSVELSNQ